MNSATHPHASAGEIGIHCLKALEVISPDTGQRLTVELEIGDRLWLIDRTKQIREFSRTELEENGWKVIQAKPPGDYTSCSEPESVQ